MLIWRRSAVCVAIGGILLAGCSEQDTARIRSVGAKTLSRAESLAHETHGKLKDAIHPLPGSPAIAPAQTNTEP